jgi:hypothetical protein
MKEIKEKIFPMLVMCDILVRIDEGNKPFEILKAGNKIILKLMLKE